MRSGNWVFVVDDDESIRTSVRRLLSVSGYAVDTFGSASQLLDRLPLNEEACILIDLLMPEMDGLQLQQFLRARGCELPVVFLTGNGDIPSAVQAMQEGAVDFLTKPYSQMQLLGVVDRALGRNAARRAELLRRRELRQRLETLTPREREVFERVVSGRLNKQMAAELGASTSTIKIHRARVMEKMGAESVPDLVRAADCLGLSRPDWPKVQ
jgi:FixJ family two-component response regulator